MEEILRNIAFVIWMVGMLVSETLSEYVNEYLLAQKYSDIVDFVASLVFLVIYLGIGMKLYEPRKES